MEYKINDLIDGLGSSFADEYYNNFLEKKKVIDRLGGSIYVKYKEQGIELCFDKFTKELTSIFLYAGKFGKMAKFEGRLVENLNFRMSRNEIIELLGEPTKTFDGINSVGIPKSYLFSREKYGFKIYYSDMNFEILYLSISFELGLLSL
jgi:hypothetical protein